MSILRMLVILSFVCAALLVVASFMGVANTSQSTFEWAIAWCAGCVVAGLATAAFNAGRTVIAGLILAGAAAATWTWFHGGLPTNLSIPSFGRPGGTARFIATGRLPTP